MARFGNARCARLMMGAAVGALTLGASAAWAETKPITIPAQSLASALHEFGSQTGRPIMFSPAAAAAKDSGGVNGVADQQLALAQLLEGTGLTYRREGDAYVIVAPGEGGSDPQSGSAAGDGAEGTVDALIVTAQKREEDIQDVPIAISAFTQESLERSQIAGGPDLMTQVPNMTFTKTNFTGYSIQLRGIGTQAISATTDAAVAVSFNNTSFIRNRFFEQEFYDLQRVEVLRGPQGTLYGRNATAGVVNLISAKPKFDYEAKLSADISNYSSTRLEGMVNVPLVEDKVALRLAGAWTKREGFVTNEITGNPIDGRDLWSTRLSLRFAPTDALDVNLIWEHFEEDDDRLRSGKQLCNQDSGAVVGTAEHRVVFENAMGKLNLFSQGCLPVSLYAPESFQSPNGFSLPYYYPLIEAGVPIVEGLDPYLNVNQSRDLRVIESTVDPKYRAKDDLVELQASYDITDNLTLMSETSYLYDTIWSLEDYNRFNTSPGAFSPQGNVVFRDDVMHTGPNGFPEFCDPQIGCADRLVAMDISTAKSKQFSQEFRLSSDYDGPFNFSVGGNYLRYDTEDKYYVFINTITLFAAAATFGVQGGDLPPWQPNGSDNQQCFSRGERLPYDAFTSIRGCMYIDPNPVESLNDLGHNYFLSRNPYKLISYAVFGEAYYNITDNLKLTAGLRFTRDKKEAPRIPSQLLAARSVGYLITGVEEQQWDEPTGRLALDWKPDLSFTDETLLYASYSHGYKAGGANPPPATVTIWDTIGVEAANVKVAASAAAPRIFDAEFVDAFELGSKNTFADGKVTLNLAAFYYDYTGYQISQIIDRSAVNYNFDSKIWGLEVEADWRPLENLRLGFKGGYEHTEIADGERAIDIMDRTAGQEGWVVVRPYPTYPSNCVLPTSVIDPDFNGSTEYVVDPGSGVAPCEEAYVFQHDPVADIEYPDDLIPAAPPMPDTFPDYEGFNPKHDYGNNGGAGFFKELGGNELPNAPHFTATVTADYTLPLPNDWLATLHTDLYYQSEAWTRVFNTEGYDKLKAYTNVNVAAIFTNEDAGWKVMAYVKNVMDRDSITGAFLNSDDTGLTTNVFLTEPRLYGLRVTKDFDGGPWSTGANGTGPYPLWVELGGTVLRQDAPYESLRPAVFDAYVGTLDPTVTQHRDFDWGDQRQVRLSYKPVGSRFSLRGEYRYGDANTGLARNHHREDAGPGQCLFAPGSGLEFLCPIIGDSAYATGTNWADSNAWSKEEHTLAEFAVGMDVGLGALADAHSVVAAGLRFGQFQSHTSALLDGVDDFYVAPNWAANYDRYRSILEADREFEGSGPVLSWEAAQHLLGADDSGHLDIDWAAGVGVLFGKQETSVTQTDSEFHFDGYYNGITPDWDTVINMTTPVTTGTSRSEDVTVPFVDLSLGLSYEIQRVKIGAGYRWERYFDVLDVGYGEHQDADRTMDGPYFKLAIGFGG